MKHTGTEALACTHHQHTYRHFPFTSVSQVWWSFQILLTHPINSSKHTWYVWCVLTDPVGQWHRDSPAAILTSTNGTTNMFQIIWHFEIIWPTQHRAKQTRGRPRELLTVSCHLTHVASHYHCQTPCFIICWFILCWFLKVCYSHLPRTSGVRLRCVNDVFISSTSCHLNNTCCTQVTLTQETPIVCLFPWMGTRVVANFYICV